MALPAAIFRPRNGSRTSPWSEFEIFSRARTRTRRRTIAVFAAWLLVLPLVRGQAPPSQDPLMSLMLATPPIDVDSPVVPAASFDPPIVRPGEWTTYRAT